MGLFCSLSLRTGKNKSLMREHRRIALSPGATRNVYHQRHTELVFADAAKVSSSGRPQRCWLIVMDEGQDWLIVKGNNSVPSSESHKAGILKV